MTTILVAAPIFCQWGHFLPERYGFLNAVATSSASIYLASHAKKIDVGKIAAVHGYTTAFSVSAVLPVLAAIIAAAIVRTSRRDAHVDSVSRESIGQEPVFALER